MDETVALPTLLSLNSYHYRRGGSDAVYFEHEAMFAALGWQTAHMAMHHPKNVPSRWSEFFVDEIEFGHAYSMWAKAAMAARVVYSLEARRKLRRLLTQVRPSVAHVHCIYHHLSPSVLPLLRERGIPVVMTAHDLKIACPAYKMLNRGGVCERCRKGNLVHVITQRCVRDSLPVSALVAVESSVSRLFGLYRNNLSCIVAPSLFYMQKLQEWGWPASQLIHIPNYVDADRLEPRFAPGTRFVYFGRIAPEKGVLTLIRAARAAGVGLLVVGTGPLEDEARLLAADGDVRFTGFLAGDALHEAVRECRAVVLPSEWYENAPMSVLEAFALGKPVIGARMGGIPELIVEDENGMTFESGNVEALAAALRRFADLPASRLEAMGRFARESVARDFSAQRYRASMLALYGDVMRSPVVGTDRVIGEGRR